MNLKQIKLIKRVQDLSEAEQTDELKKELYDLTLAMVRRYQPLYYVQYRGEIEDLASDFYVEFLTKKARGTNPKESLLDKFDPEVTNLPYLTKVSVIRKLIDRSRSDKGEVNYSENFDDDDDAHRLTMNILSQRLSGADEEAIENITFTEDFIGEMKDKFNELSQEDKDAFKKQLNYYRKQVGLHANFDELFSYLESDMEEEIEKGRIVITGTRPNYVVEFYAENGEEYEMEAKSRNLTSVISKAMKAFPGGEIDYDASVKDAKACRDAVADTAKDYFQFLTLSSIKDSVIRISEADEFVKFLNEIMYEAVVTGFEEETYVRQMDGEKFIVTISIQGNEADITVLNPTSNTATASRHSEHINDITADDEIEDTYNNLAEWFSYV